MKRIVVQVFLLLLRGIYANSGNHADGVAMLMQVFPLMQVIMPNSTVVAIVQSHHGSEPKPEAK